MTEPRLRNTDLFHPSSSLIASRETFQQNPFKLIQHISHVMWGSMQNKNLLPSHGPGRSCMDLDLEVGSPLLSGVYTGSKMMLFFFCPAPHSILLQVHHQFDTEDRWTSWTTHKIEKCWDTQCWEWNGSIEPLKFLVIALLSLNKVIGWHLGRGADSETGDTLLVIQGWLGVSCVTPKWHSEINVNSPVGHLDIIAIWPPHKFGVSSPQLVHKVQLHWLKQVEENSRNFPALQHFLPDPFRSLRKVWAFEAHKYHHHRIPSSAQAVPEPIKASNLSEFCMKDIERPRQVPSSPSTAPSSLCKLWSLALENGNDGES